MLLRLELGFPGPLRDRLVSAVLGGTKTATSGLYEDYLRDREPLPAVGDRKVVVDSRERTVAVVATTEVELNRLGDVDLRFAIDEGEGFESVAAWRETHVRFFTSPEMVTALGDPPMTIDDDTLLVCERFRVVERG
ncbi:MAG: ASCH domain-containing protein [Myxococcaceae bacterium]